MPQEEVQSKFQQLGLLVDGNVVFVKGFFNESCPSLRRSMMTDAHSGRIAVLRLDGDMFESTMDILFNLYDLVPVGGYVIVDDYIIREAKKAVHTFLDIHHHKVEMLGIDGTAVYWRKAKEVLLNRTWYEEFNAQRYKP